MKEMLSKVQHKEISSEREDSLRSMLEQFIDEHNITWKDIADYLAVLSPCGDTTDDEYCFTENSFAQLDGGAKRLARFVSDEMNKHSFDDVWHALNGILDSKVQMVQRVRDVLERDEQQYLQ